MLLESRLYFEAHITVQGKDIAKDWPEFQKVSERNGAKVSRFDVDEVDHYDGAWFLSFRDKSLSSMKATILRAIDWPKLNDYEVIRWKIEDTILDSKHGDSIKSLSSKT